MGQFSDLGSFASYFIGTQSRPGNPMTQAPCFGGQSFLGGQFVGGQFGVVPETEPACQSGNKENLEDEAEWMQICNLNESVLRLEELAQKREVTFKLSTEGINGLQALYHELVELNSRTDNKSVSAEETEPWFTGRRFSGLRSEDVDLLDEQTLTQLVYEFGLEKISVLPVLQMETIQNFL